MSQLEDSYQEPEGRPGTQQSSSTQFGLGSSFHTTGRGGRSPNRRKTGSQENLLLKTIRKRKENAVIRHMNPRLAGEVIKKYLLPMFEEDNRHIIAKDRAKSYGLVKDENQEENDYRLSDQLTHELSKTHDDLCTLNTKLNDTEVEADEIQNELIELRQSFLKSSAELKTLEILAQTNDFARDKRKADEAKGRQLVEQIRPTLVEFLQENNVIASDLQHEIQTNQDLQTKSIELDYGNGVLKMENDIMGERLKGLYEAIAWTSSEKHLEEVFEEEMRDLNNMIYSLTSYDRELISQIGGASHSTTRARNEAISAAHSRKIEFEEYIKFRNRMRENSEKTSKEIQELSEKCDNLEMDFQKQAKRSKDLADQCEKLRARTRQFAVKKKNNENEEQQCKNCNKYYLESENLNWSCRTHSTQFSGEMYWCCGKTTESAAGCMVQKHVPREDEDEDDLDAQDKEAVEQMMAMNQKCFSCKGFGHSAYQCGKDPNLRSVPNQTDELTRLDTVQRMKHSRKSDTSEIVSLVVSPAMLGGKMASLDKQMDDDQPSLISDDLSFEDLYEIKADYTFETEENLFDISQILTKEIEKEMTQSSKIRGFNTSSRDGTRGGSQDFSNFHRGIPRIETNQIFGAEDYMSMESTDRGVMSIDEPQRQATLDGLKRGSASPMPNRLGDNIRGSGMKRRTNAF